MTAKDVEHLKTDPCESGGWISPFGDFYGCPIYQHDALAHTLAQAWYGDSGGTRVLETRGWTKIFASGGCDYDPAQINTDQMNSLLDILFLSENKVFQTHLMQCLKTIFAVFETR